MCGAALPCPAPLLEMLDEGRDVFFLNTLDGSIEVLSLTNY
jgi:hypothetical protein